MCWLEWIQGCYLRGQAASLQSVWGVRKEWVCLDRDISQGENMWIMWFHRFKKKKSNQASQRDYRSEYNAIKHLPKAVQTSPQQKKEKNERPIDWSRDTLSLLLAEIKQTPIKTHKVLPCCGGDRQVAVSVCLYTWTHVVVTNRPQGAPCMSTYPSPAVTHNTRTPQSCHLKLLQWVWETFLALGQLKTHTLHIPASVFLGSTP